MTTTISDLCVVCCDAPLLDQRTTADALLNTELVTRLANSRFRYDFGFSPGSGGSDRANLFFVALGQQSPANRAAFAPLAGQIDAVPAGAADAYAAALAAIATDGAALVAAVRASMGAAFDARRRLVTSQRVPPGGTLALGACMEMLAAPGDGTFTFAAGMYTVQLAAIVYADDPANPANVSFDVLANGTHALTLTGVRETFERDGELLIPLPAGDDRRLESSFVTMSGSLTLGSTSALTLKNSGSNEQGALGVLRVF